MKKHFIKSLLLLGGIGFFSSANAQTGFVGIGTNAPKAKLHIVSDTSGVLVPTYGSLFDANNIITKLSATDNIGTLIFVSDAAEQGFYYFDGTSWIRVGSKPFFKTADNGTDLVYSNSSDYGKSFVVNDDSVNYVPGSSNNAKMMFVTSKGAFRSGLIYDNSWNVDSVGNASFAAGLNNKAVSDGSVALGAGTSAIGSYSVAIGFQAQSYGIASTALGIASKSYGTNSFSSSYFGRSNGDLSTSIGGAFLNSNSVGETVVGFLNDTLAASHSRSDDPFVIDSNRIFTVGNGDLNLGTQSNAMVVQRNGNVGVGNGSKVAFSALQVNGAIADKTNVQSGTTYTYDNTDATVFDNNSGTSDVTYTLPDATTCKGRKVTVKKINAADHEIIVNASGGNVEGATSYSIAASTALSAITLQSDGTNWWIVSKF